MPPSNPNSILADRLRASNDPPVGGLKKKWRIGVTYIEPMWARLSAVNVT